MRLLSGDWYTIRANRTPCKVKKSNNTFVDVLYLNGSHNTLVSNALKKIVISFDIDIIVDTLNQLRAINAGLDEMKWVTDQKRSMIIHDLKSDMKYITDGLKGLVF